MPTHSPVCTLCRHYRDDLTCDAFETGIPDDILRGESLHLRARKGDGGVVFELREDSRDVAQRLVDAGIYPATIMKR